MKALIALVLVAIVGFVVYFQWSARQTARVEAAFVDAICHKQALQKTQAAFAGMMGDAFSVLGSTSSQQASQNAMMKLQQLGTTITSDLMASGVDFSDLQKVAGQSESRLTQFQLKVLTAARTQCPQEVQAVNKPEDLVMSMVSLYRR